MNATQDGLSKYNRLRKSNIVRLLNDVNEQLYPPQAHDHAGASNQSAIGRQNVFSRVFLSRSLTQKLVPLRRPEPRDFRRVHCSQKNIKGWLDQIGADLDRVRFTAAAAAGPSCAVGQQLQALAVAPAGRAMQKKSRPVSTIDEEVPSPTRPLSKALVLLVLLFASVGLAGAVLPVLPIFRSHFPLPAVVEQEVPHDKFAVMNDNPDARKARLLDEAVLLANSRSFTTDNVLKRLDEIFAEMNQLDADLTASAGVGLPEVVESYTVPIIGAAADSKKMESVPEVALGNVGPIADRVGSAKQANAVTSVHLRVGPGFSEAERQRIEAVLRNAGYGAIILHEMPFSISRSRVGFFREADRPLAETLRTALSATLGDVEVRDYSMLIRMPERGRLDLWLESGA